MGAARRGCSAFQVNLAGIDEGLEGPSAERTMVCSIVREENDRCPPGAVLAVNTRLTPLCRTLLGFHAVSGSSGSKSNSGLLETLVDSEVES